MTLQETFVFFFFSVIPYWPSNRANSRCSISIHSFLDFGHRSISSGSGWLGRLATNNAEPGKMEADYGGACFRSFGGMFLCLFLQRFGASFSTHRFGFHTWDAASFLYRSAKVNSGFHPWILWWGHRVGRLLIRALFFVTPWFAVREPFLGWFCWFSSMFNSPGSRQKKPHIYTCTAEYSLK